MILNQLLNVFLNLFLVWKLVYSIQYEVLSEKLFQFKREYRNVKKSIEDREIEFGEMFNKLKKKIIENNEEMKIDWRWIFIFIFFQENMLEQN